MSKRLSKISRELQIGISEIVKFLNANGIDCEENPTQQIQEDVVDFIRNNIRQSLSSSSEVNASGAQPQNINDENEKKNEQVETPLELKIIEEASKHTKLIENIIGYTSYDWHYTIAKFTGTCSQPVDFSLFDEVLCGLLLNRQMSAKEIGNVLGLDIETDPAEKNILMSAIDDLKKDKMVEGDESVLWLSDIGAEYAKNGVKFSSFTREFDLYIDAATGMTGNTKKIFSKLRSEKQSSFKRTNLPSGIEQVKLLAEVQAPEIHYPDKNYLLQECTPIGVEGYIAKVWVILLENFRDKTNRALVFDEVSGSIIKPLSEAISQNEVEMQNVLNKLISENDAEDFSVELTSDDKNSEQIQQEQELIKQQEAFDTAVESQNAEAIISIQNEVKQIKRHFNSLEFEVELKRLFDETNGELWIISPWIKNATFKRIPFFKNYMAKGGKIFVAYSEPEKPGAVMTFQEPYEKLLELEKQYHNFYIHELPPFHYKRVWLLNDGIGTLYYTGSYNILSFFVQQGQTNIRQEEMTRLDWNDEESYEYTSVLAKFSEKYFNQASDEFNTLCANAPEVVDKSFLTKLKAFSFTKLKTFVGRGIETIDKMFEEIESAKRTNLEFFRNKYCTAELSAIRTEAQKLTSAIVSVDKKRSLQSRTNTFLNEFPEIAERVEFQEVQELIQSIKTPKFDKKKGKKRR